MTQGATSRTTFECGDVERLLEPYLDGEFGDDDRASLETHLSACAGCRDVRRVGHGLPLGAARAAARGLRPRGPARHRPRRAAPPHLRRPRRRGGAPRRLVAPHPLPPPGGGHGRLRGRGAGGLRRAPGHRPPGRGGGAQARPRPAPRAEHGIHRAGGHPRRSWRASSTSTPSRRPSGARGSSWSGRASPSCATGPPPTCATRRRAAAGSASSSSTTRSGAWPTRGTRSRPEPSTIWVMNMRGYNVAVWRRNEIVYSLVSDLDEADLVRLVETAQSVER